jgi:hypothetical protein
MKPNKQKKFNRRFFYPFLISLTLFIFILSLSLGYYVVDKNTKGLGKFLTQETIFSYFTNQNIAYITVFNQNFQVSLPSF